MDLGFLLDGSGSVNHYGAGNFDKCKEFVKALIHAFVISPDDTRVGVILFSSRSELQFDFAQLQTEQAVEAAIDRIKYPGYTTKTGAALKMAGERLFNNVRGGVPRVLIVITDGRAGDDVRAPAEALRNKGVIIFSVGLGNLRRLRRFQPQLEAMASESIPEHLFTADFPDMMSIVTAIQTNLCRCKKSHLINVYFPDVKICFVFFCSSFVYVYLLAYEWSMFQKKLICTLFLMFLVS